MAEAAGERTEEPTPRRLEEARRRGDVPRSRDLSAAAVMAVLFGTLALAAPAGVTLLVAELRAGLLRAGAAGGEGALAAAGVSALRLGATLLALPLGAALAVAVAVGFLQTGGLFSFGPLRLDPARLLPSARKVLSTAALAEVGKGLLQLALVGAGALWAAAPLVRGIAGLTGAGGGRVLGGLAAALARLALPLVLATAALGVLDHLWARHRHRRSLRMTREEVKREVKEAEGDPHHKAERQRLHRALAEQRMLGEVRRADFVVVNPDHLAVAVRYDRDGAAAPIVVARGERLLAEKIKEVAREAGVPIFREVSLARALGEQEEGDEIPEALYEAVAEILRVVHGWAADGGTAPRSSPAGPAARGGAGGGLRA